MEQAARRRMPKFAFDYLQGGIGVEACLKANIYAITVAGEDGVNHAVTIFQGELQQTFAQLACEKLADLRTRKV